GKRFGNRRIGMAMHDRFAVVAALRHPRINWHLAKKRHTRFAGHLAAATLPEDVMLGDSIQCKEAHVLNDTQYRHPHLTKHFKSLAGINQGHILRGGNYNSPRYWCSLR